MDPHRPCPEFDPSAAQARWLNEIRPRLAWQGGGQPDNWKKELSAALRRRMGIEPPGCPLEPSFGPVEHAEGWTIRRLSFACEPGVRAPAWLVRPTGVRNPPVVICLQGHSTGAHVSVGEVAHADDRKSIEGGRDFALQAAKLGFAALAIEQRAFGLREDRRPNAVRHANLPRFSDHYRCEHVAMTELLLGRTLLGSRVHDVRRACDLIETIDDLDASRIAVMGNSGGGTVSWYAACVEPRIAAVMPSCSFCPFGPSIGSVDHCADNFLPGALLDFDLPDLAGLIAPRPLVVVAGAKDHLFPIEAVRRGFETVRGIYASAGSPGRCVLVEGAAGHRFYPDEAWPAFRELTGW